jgi:hypothetical protein
MSTKIQTIMIGSLPMSLSELALAPAIISAAVKNKGHNFAFLDINLKLFEYCNRDHTLYQEKTEELCIGVNHQTDPIIAQWINMIMDRVSVCQYVIISVFSQFSQPVALLLIEKIRTLYPNKIILVGGVGSQKPTDPSVVKPFGQMLLENNLIDSWQSDISTSEIERVLPQQLTLEPVKDVDFSIYELESYDWSKVGRSVPVLGSHGCVRQCSFCDVIKHFSSYSFIEADQLTKQIVQIFQQTGVAKFIFMDSLVNGSMSNFLSLLKNLSHSKDQSWLPPNFSWSGTYICRPRSTQLDCIHKLLPASGVDNLVIGVETGSDRIRFEMQKKFTNQDLLYELDAFKINGVSATLLFFPSWPTETLGDYAETLELFRQLSKYAQAQTVDSVSLGTTGFSLISGTKIDQDKDKIGLEAGPTNFLWRCRSNPELTFWETVRRRLLMAEVCEYYGIPLNQENQFRRYLNINIRKFAKKILDYTGKITTPVHDHHDFLATLPNTHTLFLSVVNSGTTPVKLTISTTDNTSEQSCSPGITDIQYKFVKNYKQSENLVMNFEFDREYIPHLNQYENGDYFANNGIYLQKIFIDQRDITYFGFNQITEQHVVGNIVLPCNYDQHINHRCVITDTVLTWNIAPCAGLQGWILEKLHPVEQQERKTIDLKLQQIFLDLTNLKTGPANLETTHAEYLLQQTD